MSNFPILDLVVGMVFIFFLLSVINNSFVEIILTFGKARAKILAQWLRLVFSEKVSTTDAAGKPVTVSLADTIMDHVAVTALSGKGKSPSYIDAKNFATALLEKVTAGSNPNAPEAVPTSLDQVVQAITSTPLLSTELKRVFLGFAVQAKLNYDTTTNKTQSPYDGFVAKIENWYDTSTARLTGNLKSKWTLPLTILVATGLTLSLNVDSISLAQYLYANPDIRAKVAADAYSSAKDTTMQNTVNSFVKANPTSAAQDSITLLQLQAEFATRVLDIKKADATLQNTFPMGWDTTQYDGVIHNKNNILLEKIPGWLLTILAICLGAPFWYDLLNRISNMRGTGPKPQVAAAPDANTSS